MRQIVAVMSGCTIVLGQEFDGFAPLEREPELERILEREPAIAGHLVSLDGELRRGFPAAEEIRELPAVQFTIVEGCGGRHEMDIDLLLGLTSGRLSRRLALLA